MNVLGLSINPQTFTLWTLWIVTGLSTGIFLFGLSYVISGFKYARGRYNSRLEEVKWEQPSPQDTFTETVVKILWSTVESEEKERRRSPRVFLHDATRQVAESHFEGRYLSKISMCANLLPPIGLCGTVSGMIVIFLYSGDPQSAINNGALGTKLWSTFFALIYYVTLEMLYMFLLNRSRRCIDDALKITD